MKEEKKKEAGIHPHCKIKSILLKNRDKRIQRDGKTKIYLNFHGANDEKVIG